MFIAFKVISSTESQILQDKELSKEECLVVAFSCITTEFSDGCFVKHGPQTMQLFGEKFQTTALPGFILNSFFKGQLMERTKPF